MPARRRDGLAPSRALEQLRLHVTPAGQPDTEPEPTPEAEYVTSEQAAQLLGVSRRTITRNADRLGGKLRGGRWLLDRVALEEHKQGGPLQ